MQKIIFGMLLTFIATLFALCTFIIAALQPWNYNGIGGLLGSFLGTHMLVPFIISMSIMCLGLAICAKEACSTKKM